MMNSFFKIFIALSICHWSEGVNERAAKWSSSSVKVMLMEQEKRRVMKQMNDRGRLLCLLLHTGDGARLFFLAESGTSLTSTTLFRLLPQQLQRLVLPLLLQLLQIVHNGTLSVSLWTRRLCRLHYVWMYVWIFFIFFIK